jgi:hypothetical protein
MIIKPPDHFEIAGYEVRFLQSAPVTVCVIRSLTDRHQKYTGVSVCHPDDTWDETVGRHKALKEAVNDSRTKVKGNAKKIKETIYAITFSVYGDTSLPVKEIQRAYYRHYMETWKMGEIS